MGILTDGPNEADAKLIEANECTVGFLDLLIRSRRAIYPPPSYLHDICPKDTRKHAAGPYSSATIRGPRAGVQGQAIVR